MLSIWSNYLRSRHIISTIVLLAFILSTFTSIVTVGAQEKKVTVVVNGKGISFDVPPFIDENGRTMVPLRFILEELGSEVYWDGDNQEITVVQASKTIKLWINKSIATIDGQEVKMDTVPLLIDDRTLVPLRFISENLGAQVGWDPQDYVVTIQHNQPSGEGDHRLVAIVSPVSQSSNVNIRSGPGTNFPIIDQVGSGTILNVVKQDNDWHQIHTLSGEIGWISSSLITLRHVQSSSRGDNHPQDRDLPGEETPGGISSGKNEITGVYVNEVNGLQVVTIEATDPVTYNTLRLFNDDPKKLVIDINNAVLSESLIKNNLIMVNKEPLIQTRLGQFTPDTVRVVLDLSSLITFTTQTNASGNIISFNLVEPNNTLSGKTIVIDPGHGTVQPGGWLDPGAVGPTGLHERVVALDISNKLAKILEAEGAKVILTHTGSTTLTLAGRAQVATNNNADIFVSIHANANVNRNINGTMTFYYNGGSNSRGSQLLAIAIQNELVKKIQRRDIGIDTANFSVLRNGTVPSVLVETAFISNIEEERLLADPQFRTRAAEGIANGIVSYFATN